MKTRLPISTISFNTESFLKGKLRELQRNHFIDFWAYVKHVPEKDESKEHFHVWIYPNITVNTGELEEEFKEIDPHNSKPKRCMPFRQSQSKNKLSGGIDDWILYSIHDIAYLASKGQSREFHYQFSDVVSSDPDALAEYCRNIDYRAISEYQQMEMYQNSGLKLSEFLYERQPPIQQVGAFRIAWKALEDGKVVRNHGVRHDFFDTEDSAAWVDLFHNIEMLAESEGQTQNKLFMKNLQWIL